MSAPHSPRRSHDDAPAWVLYARGVLVLQAVIWLVVASGSVPVLLSNIRYNTRHEGLYLGFGSVAGLLIALLGVWSWLLAARLERGRNRSRLAAVCHETVMTALGLFLAVYAASSGAGITAALPLLAGLLGAALSAGVAVGLLLPPARRYARPTG